MRNSEALKTAYKSDHISVHRPKIKENKGALLPLILKIEESKVPLFF